MLYKRGKRGGGVWYFDFYYAKQRHVGCTGCSSHAAAKAVEAKKLKEVQDAAQGLGKPKKIPIFSLGAQAYLTAKKSGWAAKTFVIESTNIAHLNPHFGNSLLGDISADQCFEYLSQRTSEKAAAKTISLELSSLRAVLFHHNLDALWRSINKHVKVSKMTKGAKPKGRVLTFTEEQSLLDACRQSRSRSIYLMTLLGLDACLRIDEIRHLRWVNVDLRAKTLITDESKTEDGRSRTVPLTERLQVVLSDWAGQFPKRRPGDYLIPSEKYGEPKDGKPTIYSTDPSRPLRSIKYAWKEIRKRSGLPGFRFHDLRHCCVTHLLETGTPFAVVAKIAGWSEGTMVKMSRVYGHIGDAAREQAIARLDQLRRENESRQISQQADVSVTMRIQ